MEMRSSLPCSQERAIVRIINQLYPVPRLTSYPFQTHFNIIVTCIHRSSRLSLLFRVFPLNVVRFQLLFAKLRNVLGKHEIKELQKKTMLDTGHKLREGLM